MFLQKYYRCCGVNKMALFLHGPAQPYKDSTTGNGIKNKVNRARCKVSSSSAEDNKVLHRWHNPDQLEEH